MGWKCCCYKQNDGTDAGCSSAMDTCPQISGYTLTSSTDGQCSTVNLTSDLDLALGKYYLEVIQVYLSSSISSREKR